MSGVASTIGATPANAAAATTKDEHAEKIARDAKKAGGEFEAILVRQMLTSARVGGTSGYADMAVEAVANAVTAGGGLGLGRQIADAIGHLHAASPTKHAEGAPVIAAPETACATFGSACRVSHTAEKKSSQGLR